MKINILGSGSVYGVPLYFNDFGGADKDDKAQYRNRSSIYMNIKGHDLLFDMPPEFRILINKNNITNIDAVFITHGHYDHIASIPELQRASEILGHVVEVYCSRQCFAEIKHAYHYMFDNTGKSKLKYINWNVFDNGDIVKYKNVELKTFAVPHGRLQTTVFRYKNFALVMDLEDMPNSVINGLKNLDLLIIECNNGLERLYNGHSDFYKVSKWISEMKPKKTILTHISARADIAELKKQLPSNIELAFDGMIIDSIGD
jgi:phosphoribosyl 1,2-cyclic phosphate phosphodiesterase